MTQIQHIDISRLTLNRHNPRKITQKAMQALCDSIRDDPQYLECRPVLAVRNGMELVVYAGNQRCKAAKKLGHKQIPCIIDEELTEQQIKQRIIKDNKNSGEWDYDMLAGLYDAEELLDLGFDSKDLELDMSDPQVEDIVNEEDIHNKCETCGQKIKKNS